MTRLEEQHRIGDVGHTELRPRPESPARPLDQPRIEIDTDDARPALHERLRQPPARATTSSTRLPRTSPAMPRIADARLTVASPIRVRSAIADCSARQCEASGLRQRGLPYRRIVIDAGRADSRPVRSSTNPWKSAFAGGPASVSRLA
jgi:hypothetical protein